MICYHGSQPQEGSHNNQPSEKAEASESKLDRYSFYYVGRNQRFEAEQQRSTDAYFYIDRNAAPHFVDGQVAYVGSKVFYIGALLLVCVLKLLSQ